MPNFKEVLQEIFQTNKIHPNKNAYEIVRRKYLYEVSRLTGRNVIAYYSGWLQKPKMPQTAISDRDKSGFMLTINKLDKSKGLDLILHTPGGDLAATESLVDYLYSIFGTNIRAIVPQIAMSAGTMIALASKEIIMGKQSNLGPIDPQMGGLACVAVLNEFEQAKKDVIANPQTAELWKVIIGKYHPTLLGACQQAIDWSKKIVEDWLKTNMFKDQPEKVEMILSEFADHEKQKSHQRHISKSSCEKLGLKIFALEENQELQDAVLTVHHAFVHTFLSTNAVKLIENQNGLAYVEATKNRKK